ncbi:hypothetical protein EDB80DRAFT_691559 [Ilyonectria destructans]|nr:hypothetical protein EDB80DRAFT_691559 [Ilyonectria destructans]
MGWAELVTKGNQMLLRRAQMDGRFRRHHIRESPDPLDPVELENLGRWSGEGPYVKEKDPENVQLPFRELDTEDLPFGHGFDQYGLMIRRQSKPLGEAISADSSFDMAIEKILDAVLVQDVPEGPSAAANVEDEDASSTEPPADNAYVSSPRHSQLLTLLSSPPDFPLTAFPFAIEVPSENAAQELVNNIPSGSDAGNRQLSRDDSRPTLRTRPTSSADESASKIATECAKDAGRQSTWLRRQKNRPEYHETPTRSSKPSRHRPGPPNAEDLHEEQCCPSKIPVTFLTFLDKWDGHAAGQMLFMSPSVSYQDMCHAHLKKFAEAVTKAELLRSSLKAEKDLKVASSNRSENPRRRRASLPDLIDNTDLKRLRSNRPEVSVQGPLPTMLRHYGRPTHDLIFDESYRQRVLRELKSTEHEASSRRRRTDDLISQILEKKDLGLDRTVSIQVPSRSSLKESFETKTILEVRNRFLSQRPTNDPWNLLNLQSPLCSTLPSFLEGENCQLLLRVRDAVLMGSSAQRIAASGEDWNTWRNVTEWTLLSEGGHHTEPHMDSDGYSTWITAQEGDIGFGWMSHPSQQEEDAWISDPRSCTGGEWRYAILSPGQMVFFPSGTIHFIFRTRGVQTLALGGHIRQWSSIERCLKVIVAQIKNPEVTNKDMASSAPKLLHVVKGLVANRARAGRAPSRRTAPPSQLSRAAFVFKWATFCTSSVAFYMILATSRDCVEKIGLQSGV